MSLAGLLLPSPCPLKRFSPIAENLHNGRYTEAAQPDKVMQITERVEPQPGSIRCAQPLIDIWVFSPANQERAEGSEEFREADPVPKTFHRGGSSSYPHSCSLSLDDFRLLLGSQGRPLHFFPSAETRVRKGGLSGLGSWGIPLV